jgi:hypothetical protein
MIKVGGHPLVYFVHHFLLVLVLSIHDSFGGHVTEKLVGMTSFENFYTINVNLRLDWMHILKKSYTIS